MSGAHSDAGTHEVFSRSGNEPWWSRGRFSQAKAMEYARADRAPVVSISRIEDTAWHIVPRCHRRTSAHVILIRSLVDDELLG
jgi:hypothetical protein